MNDRNKNIIFIEEKRNVISFQILKKFENKREE